MIKGMDAVARALRGGAALCLAAVIASAFTTRACAQEGVPPEIAAALRKIGPVVNPRAVGELYAPLLATQPTDGVERRADAPYGPAARHRLDLYKPASSGPPSPVAIFLHGGGFIRGDKTDRSNVGQFLARNGVIALLPNYRLAPQDPWPAGAEDAARVVEWARAHAAEWGGDPERVVLMGESAGAAHAAAAALTILPGAGAPPAIAGLALLSGVYDIDLESRAKQAFQLPTPDPRNDAYFGMDPAAFKMRSVLLNLRAPAFPVLIGYAALDPAQMQVQAGALFTALCRLGPCPELRWFADHDHISPGSSINTPDTSVSRPIMEFIRAAKR